MCHAYYLGMGVGSLEPDAGPLQHSLGPLEGILFEFTAHGRSARMAEDTSDDADLDGGLSVPTDRRVVEGDLGVGA